MTDLLSPAEAAAILRVNRQSVYRLIRTGKLAPVRERPLLLARADVQQLDADGWWGRGRGRGGKA